MLRVSNLNETPPGGWRYRVPETDKMIGPTPAWNDIRTLVYKHYTANSILPPANLEDKIHEYVCAQIPPMFCEESTVFALRSQVRGEISAADLLRGVRIMAEWTAARLVGQSHRVTKKVAEARADVCVSCPNNVPTTECKPCKLGEFIALVTRISGGETVSVDSRLGGCKVCGCGLKAKIWLPKSILNKNITQEQLAKYPAFCWLVDADME